MEPSSVFTVVTLQLNGVLVLQHAASSAFKKKKKNKQALVVQSLRLVRMKTRRSHDDELFV